MNDAKVNEAIAWARQQKPVWSEPADRERATGRLLGAVPDKVIEPNGIVIRRGYIVAEFGDTLRVAPSYSVAKSYLATLFGLALDRGLVKSVTDPVRDYVNDGGYDSPHNAKITWEHHLRQMSEWDGTLFGKPSSWVGAEEFGASARAPRALAEPGTLYEYNDVRINRLSLSLLRVWKRPLPEVLKTEIMDPIGASDTWQYLGYDNSDVVVDGRTMKSVSGGTRWGGGLWMNTFDHARFGYLMLRGNWNGRQILPTSWIKAETTPGGPTGSEYGYLWYTNTKGGIPYASRSSFRAEGDGPNSIVVDPELDLVIVWRYANGAGEFVRRIVGSIEDVSPLPTTSLPTLDGLLILQPSATLKVVTIKSVSPVLPPEVPPIGVAVWSVLVSPTGKVHTATIMRGVHPLLDQAVMDAMKQWEWEPVVVNGVAHPVQIYGSYSFDRLAERLKQDQQQPPAQQR
jgi:CubicO group peptidase (beta-lactamase class C family)